MFSTYLCHHDESSEGATARQHTVAEVACQRLKRTLMGCADPPSKGFGAEVNHRGFFVWLFPWTTMFAMDRLSR